MCVLSTYLPVQNRSLKTIHIFIGDNLRPMGCPGIDDEFGNRTHRLWPFRNNKNTANYASRQMVCGVNEYIPEGEDKPVYQVVDELAADNELFAENFLDSWHIMTTHGTVLQTIRKPKLSYYAHGVHWTQLHMNSIVTCIKTKPIFHNFKSSESSWNLEVRKWGKTVLKIHFLQDK